MYKGTTPTFTLTFPTSVDLSLARNVYVTFSNGAATLQKTGSALEIEENIIKVFLTQEETLSFPAGDTVLQVNWTYSDNGVIKRAASEIVSVNMRDNLENEVLE